MECEIKNPTGADEIGESDTQLLISKKGNSIKNYLRFDDGLNNVLRRNSRGFNWSIILVLLFTICNSMITAHYLTSFSFELKNDMFSYFGFIILSIFGIAIINARWIKIVAEKYAEKL